MIATLLVATLIAANPVRAERVEARPPLEGEGRPSTSSGRTGKCRSIQTAIDAERAFAADAQTLGQWTAFRKWAAADAIMFVPGPIRAQAWLEDRRNPAKAIEWWPTAAWLSCDGLLAVNTGGARYPDGSHGYFTTVWQRQSDGGWRWVLDHGDRLSQSRPRPVRPAVVRAKCGAPAAKPAVAHGPMHGGGRSPDRTLVWEWGHNATGRTRAFSAYVWDGRRYVDAMEDLVAVE
jgi:hypothetical protein